MENPFKTALNKPNSFFIDVRSSGMKPLDPIFDNDEEVIKETFNTLKKKGFFVSVYKVDSEGKASFYFK